MCLSGSGGTAHCGYSLDSCFHRKTKSVKRRRTENSGFWKDWKSDYGRGYMLDTGNAKTKLRLWAKLPTFVVTR